MCALLADLALLPQTSRCYRDPPPDLPGGNFYEQGASARSSGRDGDAQMYSGDAARQAMPMPSLGDFGTNAAATMQMDETGIKRID